MPPKAVTGPLLISKVGSQRNGMVPSVRSPQHSYALLSSHVCVGHVVEFCQDQNGSRFIQQRLEVGNLKEKQFVMSEVLPEVQHLRNDVFGNYVVQKLLEFGTPEMKADLRDTLKGEMLALSLQMYG